VRLVIVGGSGSGKSTQAHKLCTQLEIPLIATGELLRQAIANFTNLGRFAQPYMATGELVPDEVIIEFILNQLKQPDAKRG